MDTMQEVTFRLPTSLFERLAQTAAFRHQPMEYVLAEALEISLPSLIAQAEAQMNKQVERLKNQNEKQLRLSTQASLSATDQTRLAELLDRNKEESLHPSEENEIEALLDKVGDRPDVGPSCSSIPSP